MGLLPARRPPPRLGEHNDVILAELCYPPRDVDSLRAGGVIR